MPQNSWMNIQVVRKSSWIWQVIINSPVSSGLTINLVTGKDATDAFEDVGHSDEAREILAGLLKGELERRVHSYLSKLDSDIRWETPSQVSKNPPTKSKASFNNKALVQRNCSLLFC